MDDREIVAALAAGDPDGLAGAYAGLAGAYDAYAGSLYGYCRWMLAEPGDAAEAVRDTFVLAATELGRLRDPAMVRTWLFSTARSECLRRPRADAVPDGAVPDGAVPDGAVPDGAVPDGVADGAVPDGVADGVSDAEVADAGAGGQDAAAAAARVRLETERAELRRLIRGTLATLTADEREAVQLSLWHDMDETDLATVLSVSWPRASDLVSGGQRKLEGTLGALRIARTRRGACPELGTLLAGCDGPLTVPVLGLVSEHIEQCAGCGDGKRGTLRPEALTRLLPLPALPAGLRELVLGPAADADNAAAAPVVPSPSTTQAGLAGLAGLTRLAGSAGLAGLARQVRGAEWASPAMRAANAGWNLVRRSPRATIAAAAMLVAVAACVLLITANDAHAARDLAARSDSGSTGASGPAATTGNGTTAGPGAGSSSVPGHGGQASQAPGSFLTPSATSPGKVTPSKSPRPRLSGSPQPSASASASSASSAPSASASPAPSQRKSPTPTPTPTPTSEPTPTTSPSPSSSATPTDTPT